MEKFKKVFLDLLPVFQKLIPIRAVDLSCRFCVRLRIHGLYQKNEVAEVRCTGFKISAAGKRPGGGGSVNHFNAAISLPGHQKCRIGSTGTETR